MMTHHDLFQKKFTGFCQKNHEKSRIFNFFFTDSESARHAESESIRKFFVLVKPFWSI